MALVLCLVVDGLAVLVGINDDELVVQEQDGKGNVLQQGRLSLEDNLLRMVVVEGEEQEEHAEDDRNGWHPEEETVLLPKAGEAMLIAMPWLYLFIIFFQKDLLFAVHSSI